MRRTVGLGVLLLLAGCARQPAGTLPVTIDSAAHAYIGLAVALGEHDPDSIDFYDGSPEWVADIRKAPPPLHQIRQSSLELVHTLQTMTTQDAPTATRREFLVPQLQAIACRAELLGGAHKSFDEEARCFFGVSAPASYDEATLGRTRRKIAALVGGRGTPAARLATYEARYVIPPDRLRAVMERALEGCRAQTLKHMALPSDESVELQFTGHKPWAGFSHYLGGHRSVITINTDFPVTVDHALDLACHEGYPGHHAFNVTRDNALVRGSGAVEMMVQPTYSPQSFVSEGAATLAGEIAFSPAERLSFERDILFPLAGLSADVDRYLKVEALVARLHFAIPVIAREYLDGRMEFARASEALEEKALMKENFDTLKYMNEFRSYVLTYTDAPDLLRAELPTGEAPDAVSRRWRVYTGWMRSESTQFTAARVVCQRENGGSFGHLHPTSPRTCARRDGAPGLLVRVRTPRRDDS